MSLLSLSKKRNAAVARAKSRTDPQKKAEDLAEVKSLNERIAKLKNGAGEASSTVSQQPRRRFWQQEAPSTSVVGNNNANSSGNQPRSTASGSTRTPQEQATINHELSVCNFSSNFPETDIPSSACRGSTCKRSIPRRNTTPNTYGYYKKIGSPPPFKSSLINVNTQHLDRGWRDASEELQKLLRLGCLSLDKRIRDLSTNPMSSNAEAHFIRYFGYTLVDNKKVISSTDKLKVKNILKKMRSILNTLTIEDFYYGVNDSRERGGGAAWVGGYKLPIGISKIFARTYFKDAHKYFTVAGPVRGDREKAGFILHEVAHLYEAGKAHDVKFRTKIPLDGVYNGRTQRLTADGKNGVLDSAGNLIWDREKFLTEDGDDNGYHTTTVGGVRTSTPGERYIYTKRVNKNNDNREVAYGKTRAQLLANAEEWQIVPKSRQDRYSGRAVDNADNIAYYITEGN